jgi:hypothetical protein
MSQALEESRARRKRSQFIVRDYCTSTLSSFDAVQVIGSVIAIVGVIVIGVVVGVTLARKNSQSSSSKQSNSAEGSNPNDPSSFPQNPNLSRSFYGLAYTPANSQYPACGNSIGDYFFEPFTVDSECAKLLDAVIQDIQVRPCH